jgi:hypothetical protein
MGKEPTFAGNAWLCHGLRLWLCKLLNKGSHGLRITLHCLLRVSSLLFDFLLMGLLCHCEVNLDPLVCEEEGK